jgi:hypothetical protein
MVAAPCDSGPGGRMMDFSRAPLTFFIPWPILALIAIGLITIALGFGFAFWYFIFSHLHWVVA